MSTSAILRLRPADLATGRPYPERDEREPPWHDRVALALWHGAAVPALDRLRGRSWQGRAFVARVEAHATALARLQDDELQAAARRLRAELRAKGFEAAPSALGFALVREAATRVLGQRHYAEQLLAGWWLLRGMLVEMATGEGKTFAATLPACVAALAGVPVHVITVNDYLAARDADTMGPLYAFFGLRTGQVVHGLTRAERRAAYACDITYCSNKELAFDYLRDRTALGDQAGPLQRAVRRVRETCDDATVLRGLCYAIVDEADSVFVDEARTPLILSSAPDAASPQACERALAIASALAPRQHFEIHRALMHIRLTDDGCDEIERADGSREGSPWPGAREREEDVQRALTALHLYARDQQYVVVDGKVQIVDESTGRVMPDRAWERGLHQMIEAKEGLAPTGRRETLARLTYQRLFRRYLRLSGMTGTAAEVAGEIGRTYGLSVARVPLHKPSQRAVASPRAWPDAASKWRAVADAAWRAAAQSNRPVLIGTRTVAASEVVSAALRERGLEHVVLNAKQDREEAAIIARAGEPGRVTVATNMAGRGTDIALAPGVAERGGLHVILTDYHDSRRIDRQLLGRCARQGDPGTCEVFVALEDELFRVHAPWLADRLQAWVAGGERGLAPMWLGLLRAVSQWRAERHHAQQRLYTLRGDRQLARMLAFSGRGE
jgi:preprotein translocase subunit SecA